MQVLQPTAPAPVALIRDLGNFLLFFVRFYGPAARPPAARPVRLLWGNPWHVQLSMWRISPHIYRSQSSVWPGELINEKFRLGRLTANGLSAFLACALPRSGFGVYPIDRRMSIKKYYILWLQPDRDAGKLPDCKALKSDQREFFGQQQPTRHGPAAEKDL
ncbi:MAG TPA: hypothetical protein VNO70_18445 [Blastocatellia bacterium]|nr:hypothetical protein [Blastocatellia bacterium]